MEKPILNVITIKTKKSSFAYTLLEALRSKGASHFFYKKENGYVFSLVADEAILNFLKYCCTDDDAKLKAPELKALVLFYGRY